MSTVALAPPVSVSVALLPGSPRPQSGFLQRPWIPWLILGSFLVLTLPLCVLASHSDDFLQPGSLGWLYVCGLGTTHFLITLTIYLQSANLSYFSSSWQKRVLYFLVPVAIFLFFDLYRALQVAVLLPAVDVLVRAAIRFLDFQHFNRQSFGVFQLFKGRTRGFPAWVRGLESWYFFGLTVLLFLSFLTGGRFDGANLGTWLVLLPIAGCFLVLLAAYLRAWQRATNRWALTAALAYFLMQSAAAALAIADTALYLFCLAMHYVEYHVLMYPRCFHTALDTRHTVDRCFARLRSNRMLFYGALGGVAALVTLFTWLGMGQLIQRDGGTAGAGYLALIAVFDGLFVFHYFVEALIWKFSEPHYRQTLGPLYFGK
jgi:hypothetical protein